MQAALQASVHQDYRLPGTTPSYAAVAQLSASRARVRSDLGSQQMAASILAQLGKPPAVLPLHPTYSAWGHLEPGQDGPALTLVAVDPRFPPRHAIVSHSSGSSARHCCCSADMHLFLHSWHSLSEPMLGS